MRKLTMMAITLLLTLSVLSSTAMAQTTTKVKILPAQVEVGPPPVTFLLNVTVENVQLMAGYEIYISFNQNKLQCLDIVLPSDFVYAGKGYLETAKLIDNDQGTIHYGVATFPLYEFNGSGVLCQLKFNGTNIDGSDIIIITPEMGTTFYTQLLTKEATEIPYIAENGYVIIIPEFSNMLIITFAFITSTIAASLSRKKSKNTD
jgi:hypothetical protein